MPSTTAAKKSKRPRGYSRPASLTDAATHYCPGCGHGIIHRLIAEALDELEIREKAVAVAPVGCAVLAYDYWRIDVSEAPHGRTPAVATGIKRVQPDKVVFSYQGDGDLAAIGTAEIVHAANRGENICVFFVNNTVYGMTGGQMAPTTMLDQRTQTTQGGRDRQVHGNPIRVCELLATLDGSAYLERVALSSPANVRKARRAILKAFRTQLAGKGFSLVEFLSPCPTYWRMTPADALNRIDDVLAKIFPPGVFRDTTAEE
ncbi:MAG: thiamine pyrophosphate-dependent enzyme [Planctomycetota bacterium]